MGARILIVDDQVEMLRMIGMNLEAKGYQIEAAQDAATALEKIRVSPPDLLILDIMLPGMSGVEALKAIRVDPNTKNLPVMILSALSQVDDKIAGLEAGADEYLTKPIDVRELVVRVASILERSARLRQAEVPARGLVTTFLPAMGGVGTTTLALNTAVALTRTGASVIALALNPSFSSFRNYLGHTETKQAEALLGGDPGRIDRAALRQALARHPSGIRVLSPGFDPERFVAPSAEAVDALLEAAVQEASHVVVDLRPLVSDLSRVVLERSNQILLVTEPTPVCLDAAKAAAEFARRWGSMATTVACILVNRSAIAASVSAMEIGKQLGIRVVASFPHAADSMASAYRRGQLIIVDQPDQPVAEGVRTIVAALTSSPA